jgi:hypothetical protein
VHLFETAIEVSFVDPVLSMSRLTLGSGPVGTGLVPLRFRQFLMSLKVAEAVYIVRRTTNEVCRRRDGGRRTSQCEAEATARHMVNMVTPSESLCHCLDREVLTAA